MKILIANLGSTSFKYRLYTMDGAEETQLAKGGFERVTDYGACIETMLGDLCEQGHLNNPEDIDAVGFKTVLGKDLSGCVEADEAVLNALEGFKEVAPAHNPPYAAGIRTFAQKMPSVTRVALFETAFYQWVPQAASVYALPASWRKLGIRRYGFHGASHKFVAERSAELLGREDIAQRVRGLYHGAHTPVDESKPLRIVSFHLGGSSSVTGVKNGLAIGTSMGFSPQSGLPQNNRVGELDSMAVPYVSKMLGLSIEDMEAQLNKESGLLGLSGVSNDLREISEAAAKGNEDAQLALAHLTQSARHWAGSFMLQMGGVDAFVFTAGIGENQHPLRAAICEGLEGFGLSIDPAKNGELVKGAEGCFSAEGSRVKAYVIPANEELVIAREVQRFMQAKSS